MTWLAPALIVVSMLACGAAGLLTFPRMSVLQQELGTRTDALASSDMELDATRHRLEQQTIQSNRLREQAGRTEAKLNEVTAALREARAAAVSAARAHVETTAAAPPTGDPELIALLGERTRECHDLAQSLQAQRSLARQIGEKYTAQQQAIAEQKQVIDLLQTALRGVPPGAPAARRP